MTQEVIESSHYVNTHKNKILQLQGETGESQVNITGRQLRRLDGRPFLHYSDLLYMKSLIGIKYKKPLFFCKKYKDIYFTK